LHPRAFPRETYTAAETVASESYVVVDPSTREERACCFSIFPCPPLPSIAVETCGAYNSVRAVSVGNVAPIAATREELRAGSPLALCAGPRYETIFENKRSKPIGRTGWSPRQPRPATVFVPRTQTCCVQAIIRGWAPAGIQCVDGALIPAAIGPRQQLPRYFLRDK
jgi:hypothetical protein